MKILAVLCLAFVYSCSFAQTSYGSFKAEDQEIRYQKVFTVDTLKTDSTTIARFSKFYKAQPGITNVKPGQEGLTFDLNDVTVDFRKFQFRQVDVPTLIQTGKYNGKVLVEVKEGRYRVTLTSLQVTGDAGYKKITSKENLTNFACKNSGTVLNPDWCKPNTLGLLDQVFTDKLQFVGKKKSDF